MITHEALAETFAEIAETLIAEFDLAEFLLELCDRSVSLLGVDAAGLVLADPKGRLEVLAATNEHVRGVELFQLRNREGPCLDAYRRGEPVLIPDLEAAAHRWPRFTPQVLSAGFRAVHAVPMKCRAQTIGALNLFHAAQDGFDSSAVRIAQALTNVATVGLLQNRTVTDQTVLIAQLQAALESRIVIEQAKGMLAQRTGLAPDEAFTLLRRHARNHGQPLTSVAQAVIAGAQIPA